MLIFLQLLTIAALVAGTFLLFKLLGPQPGNLLYTKAEKDKWYAEVGSGMTTWFTRTNIVGTLTSVATVYLFFIGNSKYFGWWVFMCSASMLVGAFVTNFFTEKIWLSQYIQNLRKHSDLTSGIIASVFWRPTTPERQTAFTVKCLSLLSIAAFIWLDFAIFADVSGRLLGIDALWFRLLLLAISCFFVVFFTLKYGLRGFVFADIFHAPLIAVASLALVAGCAVLYFKHSVNALSLQDFFKPIIPQSQCIIFAIHVLFLNSFLVLLSEGHWLRLWIFDKKELDQQKPSQLWIAGLWGVMMLIGFFASDVSNGKAGEDATVGLLNSLTSISWIFPVAFWAGGTAALFSSADASIYFFLVVRRFDCSTGKLVQMRMAELKPMWYAALATALFAVIYAVVRYFQLPFEKIVFVVMPFTLNMLPAFVFAIRNRPQKPQLIWLSLLFYVGISIIGFRQPEKQLFWTLMAALMPAGATLIAFLWTLILPQIKDQENVGHTPKN